MMRKKLATVYLSGPIAGCTWEQIHEWRDDVRLVFHRTLEIQNQYINFLDPASRDFSGSPISDVALNKAIVEHDKNEISRSDALIVYWPSWTKSAGTAMEIIYAFSLGKLVIVLNPDKIELPRWVQYHAQHSVTTPEEARDVLVKWFNRGYF
jgi:nucleoside 2-deoxyribosyltransferase